MSGSTKRSGADRFVYCFVPSEEIDIVVLALYIKSFIDGSATIKPSRHPRVGPATWPDETSVLKSFTRIRIDLDTLSVPMLLWDE